VPTIAKHLGRNHAIEFDGEERFAVLVQPHEDEYRAWIPMGDVVGYGPTILDALIDLVCEYRAGGATVRLVNRV